MSLDFLFVSLVVAASPGIGVLYTVSAALAPGSRAGVVAALGCTVGIVPHMVAAIAGLAALLNAIAVVFQTVKYAGVLYLLYLAWTTIREHGSFDVNARGSQGSGRPGHPDRRSDQPPQPQAHSFLLRVPATVRQRERGAPSGADASPQRGVHAPDVRRLRRLRLAGRAAAGEGDVASACDCLDAAQHRRGVRRPRGQARF